MSRQYAYSGLLVLGRLALVALSALWGVTDMQAGAPVVRKVPCRVVIYSVLEACYTPSSLKEVMAFVPGRVVDPSAAVRSIAHVPLTQLVVTRGGGGFVANPPPPISSVQFEYGREPASGLPMPAPPRPRWVVVVESRHGAPASGVDVNRAVGESGGRTWYGPWTLSARLPSGWVLSITTNGSKDAITREGKAILAAARAHRVSIRH